MRFTHRNIDFYVSYNRHNPLIRYDRDKRYPRSYFAAGLSILRVMVYLFIDKDGR